MTTSERFALEVPGRPEHLATVRIFAASLARRFGLDEDTVADLKLALSEAATMALHGGADGPICVRVASVAGGLDFEIDVPAQTLAAGDGIGGLDLIRALFAGAEAGQETVRIPVRGQGA